MDNNNLKKARDKAAQLADALIGDKNKEVREWVQEVVRLLDTSPPPPAPKAITPVAMLEEEHLRACIQKEQALTAEANAKTELAKAQTEEVLKVIMVSLDQKERRHKLEMEQLERQKAELETEVSNLSEGIKDLQKMKEEEHVKAVKMEERAKAAKALLEKLNGQVNEQSAKLKPLKKKEKETEAVLTATIGEVVEQKADEKSAE